MLSSFHSPEKPCNPVHVPLALDGNGTKEPRGDPAPWNPVVAGSPGATDSVLFSGPRALGPRDPGCAQVSCGCRGEVHTLHGLNNTHASSRGDGGLSPRSVSLGCSQGVHMAEGSSIPCVWQYLENSCIPWLPAPSTVTAAAGYLPVSLPPSIPPSLPPPSRPTPCFQRHIPCSNPPASLLQACRDYTGLTGQPRTVAHVHVLHVISPLWAPLLCEMTHSLGAVVPGVLDSAQSSKERGNPVSLSLCVLSVPEA